MSALLALRPYQREALDAVAARTVSRPAVVLPTGTGKTVVFAHAAKEWLDANPGRQVLVLVHTDELANQAYAKIKAVAPRLNVGIVKAERDQTGADVVIGSVQTLRRRERRERIRDVGLVIVDECHHATAPTYRAILKHFGCMVPIPDFVSGTSDEVVPERDLALIPAIGFTATLERGDGGPLGQIWQAVAFTRDISWMVRRRYLVPPRGKVVAVHDFSLASVRSSGGDFRDSDLGDALANSLAPATVAKAYVEHAAGRRGIAFLPTVAAAYLFADAFNAEGIKCEVVHGELPLAERRAVLERLESGVTQVVANCMVLTEGFDSPAVDCIVVARPTRSRPLYVQMVGRGLRVDPARPYEEQDCLILAVTPQAATHTLRTLVDLSTRPLPEARDGASLIELEDELDAQETDRARFYAGPVQVRDFDPLAARSSRVWKRTAGGVFFLPAGKHDFVFLAPGTGPGRFDVAWCGKTRSDTRYTCCGETPARQCGCGKRETRRGGVTEHRDLDLEMAMAWAEDLAVDMGGDPYETLTAKGASWRGRRADAHPAMVSLARRLGVRVEPERLNGARGRGMRAGELSDAIDKVLATARIDRVVEKITREKRP